MREWSEGNERKTVCVCVCLRWERAAEVMKEVTETKDEENVIWLFLNFNLLVVSPVFLLLLSSILLTRFFILVFFQNFLSLFPFPLVSLLVFVSSSSSSCPHHPLISSPLRPSLILSHLLVLIHRHHYLLLLFLFLLVYRLPSFWTNDLFIQLFWRWVGLIESSMLVFNLSAVDYWN